MNERISTTQMEREASVSPRLGDPRLGSPGQGQRVTPNALSVAGLITGLGPGVAALIAPTSSPMNGTEEVPDPRPATATAPATVHRAEFHDALDPLPDGPGVLMLLPSAGRADELAALVDAASERALAGIALKCRDADVPSLAALSERSGFPLIRVADAISWRLFDALVAAQIGAPHRVAEAPRARSTEPLFSLADDLAGVFGGSVAIEDLGRRVVAYSSLPGQLIDSVRTQGILTREVPDSPFNDDQYRTVLRSANPVRFPSGDGEEPRIAHAIRSGALPLGTIWVVDPAGETPLSAAQLDRLAVAADIAAAHLLEELRGGGAAEQQRTERLRSLLSGDRISGSELAELGIDEERGAALLVFAPADGAARSELAHLRSTVQRQLALHRPETTTAAHAGRVHALVTADPRTARSSLVPELLVPLLPLLDSLVGPGIRIAAPGATSRPGEVAALADLGARLLRLDASRDADPDPGIRAGEAAEADTRIVTVDALRPLLVLDRAAALFADEPELRAPKIERLLDEDPALAGTLATWCASSGSIARTARELGVHENTVRYRLRQVDDHYGLDLRDADALLTTWLHLRALGGRNGSGSLEGKVRR